jgi:S-DNA-T family DNA segregation ATPase FtsK/SpoIIIE
MFKKKDNDQKNTLKNTPKKNKEKGTGGFKMPAIGEGIKKFFGFFENPRFQYVSGWILMTFSVFSLLAFVSYFYTWQSDQDKVEIWNIAGNASKDIVSELELQPKNMMGVWGAQLAHFFIFNLFGVASFGIPFFAFVLGFKGAFKRDLLPLGKTFRVVLFYMFLFASVLSLLFSGASLNPGGNVGLAINDWVKNVLGVVGLGLLQLVLASLSIFIFFNVKIENLVGGLFTKSDREVEPVEESGRNDFRNETSAPKVRTVYPPSEVENKEETPQDESKEEFADDAKEEIAEEEIAEEIEFDTKPVQQVPEKKEEGELKLEIEETPEEEEEVLESQSFQDMDDDYDPTQDLSRYQYPTLDLLEEYETGNNKVDPETLEEYKNKIVNTLSNYKIEIDSIKASVGPTVTLYEIVPAAGIRISKIKNLEDDIALSLAALGIRIIAPIPGRGTIGIEVPNPEPDIVPMKSVLMSKAFVNAKMDLPIALGKTISNESFVFDLAKMPHLLMAGATGQGKSVGLNCILVSLLYKKHPSQLKLVLVDPKKVELTLFNKVVRHFLAKLPDEEEAIITETQKVVNTVNSLCVEMDDRYELLKTAHCRNLKEYNAKFKKRRLNPEKGHRFLPYIVLIIDEFADLIMTAGKEVETPVARLAQLARAVGIHLIVATQRPSVNIITGTIKANFPARIAFRVTSKIDSRTILDAGGADQLIGRGDLLMSTGNDLTRIQCAFVDTPEVEKICEFIGDQQGYPDAFPLPEYNDPNAEGGGGGMADLEDRDDLFEDAARVIVLHQQGSASLLQRKLKLGYNRAGRIVDQLEAAGIIGPFEGSKARQVLIPDEYSLEQLLNAEKNNESNSDL